MDECTVNRRKLSDEFKEFRKVFIALGDETRQQIFITFLENEEIGMRVPEITKQTHLSRPAVSHHLQILKDASLIGMKRIGTMNYYYVDANTGKWSNFKKLVDNINVLISEANANNYPRIPEE